MEYYVLIIHCKFDLFLVRIIKVSFLINILFYEIIFKTYSMTMTKLIVNLITRSTIIIELFRNKVKRSLLQIAHFNFIYFFNYFYGFPILIFMYKSIKNIPICRCLFNIFRPLAIIHIFLSNMEKMSTGVRTAQNYTVGNKILNKLEMRAVFEKLPMA